MKKDNGINRESMSDSSIEAHKNFDDACFGPYKVGGLLEASINACAATESDKMVDSYQQLLVRELDAMQVSWFAVYRGKYGKEKWQTEVMKGWKVLDIICSNGASDSATEALKAYFSYAKRESDVDPQVQLGIDSAGRSRVQLLSDAVDKAAWDEHWQRRRLASRGIGERIVGVFTLSPIAESYFVVERGVDSVPFNDECREKFFDLLLKFPRLHYWLFLERGLVEPAKKPLSPQERRIVQLLLGPKSESEMAETLHITKGTVHNYVTDIFANYNVKSRVELNQLWLKKVNVF